MRFLFERREIIKADSKFTNIFIKQQFTKPWVIHRAMSFTAKGYVLGAFISSDFIISEALCGTDKKPAIILSEDGPHEGGTHARKTSESLEPQCFQKPMWNLSFTHRLSSETHTEQSHFSHQHGESR